MKQNFICISCPVGCDLTVEKVDGEVVVSGNACSRGKKYGISEYTSPVRMVTSSILVHGGKRPLVPCKTQRPVPKDRIQDVLLAIRQAQVDAPIAVGQVLLHNVQGLGIDVVATRTNEFSKDVHML